MGGGSSTKKRDEPPPGQKTTRCAPPQNAPPKTERTDEESAKLKASGASFASEKAALVAQVGSLEARPSRRVRGLGHHRNIWFFSGLDSNHEGTPGGWSELFGLSPSLGFEGDTLSDPKPQPAPGLEHARTPWANFQRATCSLWRD